MGDGNAIKKEIRVLGGCLGFLSYKIKLLRCEKKGIRATGKCFTEELLDKPGRLAVSQNANCLWDQNISK